MSEELTPEEQEQIKSLIGYGAATPEGKHNVHTFLHNVATADDTTKLGYLKEEEIGAPHFPTRSLKEMSLISDKIMSNDMFKDYFAQESEILTSTSLSRDGILIKLAVTQKRELADVTKEKKQNKGWFKKKDKDSEEGGLT